jgi:hypothetical protein
LAQVAQVVLVLLTAQMGQLLFFQQLRAMAAAVVLLIQARELVAVAVPAVVGQIMKQLDKPVEPELLTKVLQVVRQEIVIHQVVVAVLVQ